MHFELTTADRTTRKTTINVSIDALVQQHILVSRLGLMVPPEGIFEKIILHALVKFVGIQFQCHVAFGLFVRGFFTRCSFRLPLLEDLFDGRHGVIGIGTVIFCLGRLLGTGRGIHCNFRSNFVSPCRKDFSRGVFQDVFDKVFFGDFVGPRSEFLWETETFDVNVG